MQKRSFTFADFFARMDGISAKKPTYDIGLKNKMKIIDVIPIAKGIPQEKLSYFTSKDVSVGALVSVPVRKKEIIVIQSQYEERIHHYKSIVREELAKNKSVFLCLPTAADMENIAVELGRGIEKYVFVLSGKMPRKKITEEWKKIVEEKHPVLIIATKSFLSLPRRDFGAIIIDQESSSAYKNQKRPYTDARKATEIISDKIKAC